MKCWSHQGICFRTFPLLSVKAAVRILGLNSSSRETNTVLVASGVRNTGRDPDAVSSVDAVGAGNQAGTIEGEVAIGINLPALALAISGSGLSTGGVAKLSLT